MLYVVITHLLHGGVLRLVQDDKGVVEAAAPHECQRRDLDHVTLDQLGNPRITSYNVCYTKLLRCKAEVRFHATGYIPECPTCGHTVYHRKILQK